jgi:hypothetical protein
MLQLCAYCQVQLQTADLLYVRPIIEHLHSFKQALLSKGHAGVCCSAAANCNRQVHDANTATTLRA